MLKLKKKKKKKKKGSFLSLQYRNVHNLDNRLGVIVTNQKKIIIFNKPPPINVHEYEISINIDMKHEMKMKMLGLTFHVE